MIRGQWPMEYQVFPNFLKKFFFASLCSFICLQAVYQLSGPVCKSTWNGCPSYAATHLHFKLHDWFLVHSKSYNFLRDRYRWSSPPTAAFYIPKCCKLHDDSFPLYCANGGGGGGGVRKTYCARSRNEVRRLTSWSYGISSKKLMELLRTFVFVVTVLGLGSLFQGSDEV